MHRLRWRQGRSRRRSRGTPRDRLPVRRPHRGHAWKAPNRQPPSCSGATKHSGRREPEPNSPGRSGSRLARPLHHCDHPTARDDTEPPRHDGHPTTTMTTADPLTHRLQSKAEHHAKPDWVSITGAEPRSSTNSPQPCSPRPRTTRPPHSTARQPTTEPPHRNPDHASTKEAHDAHHRHRNYRRKPSGACNG